MNRWSPLWSKIVDSSLWDEPDYVVKVFLTMLAKKDLDQVVRGTAYQIGRWSRKSEEEVIRALEILSKPDTRRLEPQPNEGRRIERVAEGWKVLNGEFYVQMMKKEMRRQYQAAWQKNKRALKKGRPLPGEEAYVRAAKGGASEEELARLSEPKGKTLCEVFSEEEKALSPLERLKAMEEAQRSGLGEVES